MHYNIKQKIYMLSIAVIVLLGAIYFVTIKKGDTSHTSTAQVQSVQEDGRRFDDREWEVPAFRVMSDLDTTEVDKRIAKYYSNILENSSTYTRLTDREFGFRLKNMCKYYDDICDKMKLESEFSLKEVYNFTVFTIYLTTQIDNNTILEGIGTLRDTLASITFVKDGVDITRGKAGHRNVLINTYDMRDSVELFEIITHEIGHIMGLGVIHDDDNPVKNTKFLEFDEPAFGADDRSLKFYNISWETDQQKRNSATNKEFISGYGHTNTYEEFAEFFNAWINHQTPLLQLAKTDDSTRAKYFLFKELFGQRYLNADIETYRSLDTSTRPYDTTRRHDAAIHVD